MAILVNAKITVQEDHVAEAKAILLNMVEPTRKEDGCIVYTLVQDLTLPNVFYYIEEWESHQHLDAHRQQPHFVQYLETELVPFVIAKDVTILPLN